jgi:hypothetical protein
MSDYKSEFPNYDDILIFPEGWVDTSWHNDACPSFEKAFGNVKYRIFCDYKDMEARENPSWTRFGVYVEDEVNFECIGQFEQLDKALSFIDQEVAV